MVDTIIATLETVANYLNMAGQVLLDLLAVIKTLASQFADKVAAAV